MTELSEQQPKLVPVNPVKCARCDNTFASGSIDHLCFDKNGNCQMCRAELSGKYADGQLPKPFFKAQLPMPPSVNGYWLVKPKGKYLSAKARKFRSDVIAYVSSLGRIRTHTGRIRAQVTIHGRDKRKFDIDRN